MNPTYLDKLDDDDRRSLIRLHLYEDYPGERVKAAKMVQHYSTIDAEVLEDLLSRLSDPSSRVRDASKQALMAAEREERSNRKKWKDRDLTERRKCPVEFLNENYGVAIEPHRVCWRLIDLSYAAISDLSRAA